MLVLFQLPTAASLSRPSRLAQRRYPTQPWWPATHPGPSHWGTTFKSPSPAAGLGPPGGCARLLPPLGMEKASGQGTPGHSSVQSLKISFTRWKWLHHMEKLGTEAAPRTAASHSQGLRDRSTRTPLGSAAGKYWGPGALRATSWTNLTPSSGIDQFTTLFSKSFYTKT